jgi:hypothetical protein
LLQLLLFRFVVMIGEHVRGAPSHKNPSRECNYNCWNVRLHTGTPT